MIIEHLILNMNRYEDGPRCFHTLTKVNKCRI